MSSRKYDILLLYITHQKSLCILQSNMCSLSILAYTKWWIKVLKNLTEYPIVSIKKIPNNQRCKNPGSMVAMLPGKFPAIRKIWGCCTCKNFRIICLVSGEVHTNSRNSFKQYVKLPQYLLDFRKMSKTSRKSVRLPKIPLYFR